MMPNTKYKFNESQGVAMKFATQLLTGTLNVYLDLDLVEPEMVDVTYEKPWFSTKVMRGLGIRFADHHVSRLIFTDIEEISFGDFTAEEKRDCIIYTKDSAGAEERVAVLSLKREHCDGEHAQGWTKWSVVKAAVLDPTHDNSVLLSQQDSPIPDHMVWGVHVL